MFRLEITESAEADLDSITDYLGFELHNPSAAETLLDSSGFSMDWKIIQRNFKSESVAHD